MADITELPLNDQLLHGIGRVAQAQVRLEMTLRLVYGALAFGPASVLASTRRGVDALAQDLRVMVTKTTLDAEVQQASTAALTSARDADALRHRVVHDLWWPPGVDPSSGPETFKRWQVAKGEMGFHAHEHGLDYVQDAYDALIRADIRVGAVGFALSSQAGFAPALDGPGPEDLLRGRKGTLATIEGRFDLLDNGGYRLHDAEPPPDQ